MKLLSNYLLYLWQLPQNLLGLIFVLIMKEDKCLILDNGNKVYFSSKMSGGISLGKYSIIDIYYWNKCKGDINKILALEVTRHEGYGHGKQSKWLGPFYLLVIGLPSLIWSWMYCRIIPYSKNGYFKFYTEKWADKLAGIIRS